MRRVVWARAARADIESIVSYIAERNPVAAQAIRDRLHRAATDLGVSPTGRRGRVTNTYEKVVTGSPYIVAYSLGADSDGTPIVTILRLIHGARDWTRDRWPDEAAP
ncbi:MAG: type II toxin-antitoxin system RelE/ParE family toxin [Stellaceae bacterium]